MKKVLLLGSQHGNELLGEHLYFYIVKNRPTLKYYVEFVVANPAARQKKVRYIESDLNRSYNGKNSTYEERRANEIRSFIARGKFTLILDLHTTTCIQPPCLITSSVEHPFINASSVNHIVHMSHDIVRTSLIGVCEQAISIEINKNEAKIKATLSELCDDIERYLGDDIVTAQKSTYIVRELLKKSEMPPNELSKLRNFHKSKFGFYPILLGENSYKKQTNYLGFKAYKVEVLGYNKE